jgi:hypothetical protein
VTPLFRCVCARRPLLPSHLPAQSPGEWLPDYLSPQAGRRFKCRRTGSGHFGLGSPRTRPAALGGTDWESLAVPVVLLVSLGYRRESACRLRAARRRYRKVRTWRNATLPSELAAASDQDRHIMIQSLPINDHCQTYSCWLAARHSQARIYLRYSRTAARKSTRSTCIPVARLNLLIQTLEQTDHTTRHGPA